MKKSYLKIILVMLPLFILVIINLNSNASKPCNGNHSWETVEIIQEDTCGTQGLWKLKCATCGVTTNSTSDLYDHELVDGTCIRCGLSANENGIGPASELINWNYGAYKASNGEYVITLDNYIGKSTSITVYSTYLIDGKLYQTYITGDGYSPFYANRDKITSIIFKGGNGNGVKGINFIELFANCVNLSYLDLSGLDGSSVSLIMRMFLNCSSLKSIDLSGFDSSRVNMMEELFSGCTNLESINLDGFDTSKATNFLNMFQGCKKLKSLDLSGFDTSQVTSMSGMFYNSGLSTVDLSMLDTSKLKYVASMFANCESLSNVTLGDFNTSNVSSYLYMFSGCERLRNLDLTSFETKNASNYNSMFANCTNLQNIYVSTGKWKVKSGSSITNMFNGCAINTVTYID